MPGQKGCGGEPLFSRSETDKYLVRGVNQKSEPLLAKSAASQESLVRGVKIVKKPLFGSNNLLRMCAHVRMRDRIRISCVKSGSSGSFFMECASDQVFIPEPLLSIEIE